MTAAAAKSASKQRVVTLAFWSIIVAFAVTGLKIVAWRMTGSVALYSDALESIANVVTAIAALWAIKISHMPADSDHPFGHHKAEYFSAVLEGVLIVVAALLIIAKVWDSLRNPTPLEQPWMGLGINTSAAIVNAVWAFILIRVGRAEKSPALIADGRHVMTDVVTSAGVLIGLIGAIFTGWHVLDPLLALIVALNILYQGWRVMGESLSGLMDRAVDNEEHLRIRDIISSNSKGALEVHDLKTRIAGRATFIEFHMVVEADMTVAESHAICDRIEDALKAEIPSVRITIHVEPDDEAKLPKGTVAVPFA
ncbi:MULTISPECIES: cation diffusion facilitator family transporter [Phyllobacteriaceae]|jgi:cation diffusion facilitator family transporter|uniref:Protein p34 n=1 Tax=Mesorhizobium hungaricum TaxID=1566387 RepID=A0A1C2E8Y6_9HYPH|nr:MULTISPECIES: cation diffusion facilitator family transporter [Mesorhizobium]MBN9236715.1 cation transporter [Mesorhizobium sp.]MDQ0329121.1 cation diffusion facilitator family transporter [Mesorhizobium sp. YL-MeA3-2017]OCX23447.1 cadmium transporter [Mesorhizobium hungaricum]